MAHGIYYILFLVHKNASLIFFGNIHLQRLLLFFSSAKSKIFVIVSSQVHTDFKNFDVPYYSK
jgi:hypothetical protein